MNDLFDLISKKLLKPLDNKYCRIIYLAQSYLDLLLFYQGANYLIKHLSSKLRYQNNVSWRIY